MAEAQRDKASLTALLGLAWPVLIAFASRSVIGFSNAVMVAPLGEDALAAVTTGALDIYAVNMLWLGTVTIVQSFVSQLRGRGEPEAIAQYAWYGLCVAAVAQAVALVSLPWLGDIIGWFGYESRVRVDMTEYIGVRLLAIFAAVGMEALAGWFRGLGDTRTAMLGGMIAMVLSIVGSYLLLEPHGPLPGYGVSGCAWASVGAAWAGFAFLYWRYRAVRRASLATQTPPRWSEFVRVLRYGVPSGVNWFLEFSALALFINLVVSRLGTTTLAAFNVVLQLNSISFMPAFGVATAGAILVGEAIGRRSFEDVGPMVKLTSRVACAWMGSVAIVYVTCGTLLMRFFQPRDLPAESMVEIGGTMLTFAAFWQLFDALGMTFGEALRAAGDTTWCMAAQLTLAWLVFTPVACVAVLVLGGSVDSMMASLLVYTALVAVAYGLRFASNGWRRIELVAA